MSASGDYREIILAQLAAIGLEPEDEESREYTLVLLDDVTSRFLSAWMGRLAEEDGGVRDRLGDFADAVGLPADEVLAPFFQAAHPVVSAEEFDQLIVLAVAGLKYVDWRAKRLRKPFEPTLVDECADELARQTRQQMQAEGALVVFLDGLTPATLTLALLEEMARQSAGQGMDIFQ